MLHSLKSTQLIKQPLEKVWDFMSSPKNLAVITPKHMQFEVLSDEKGLEKMYQGQIIEYYVRPVLGIKLHWVTEITHVKENEFFVDEQRFGPYSFWHHQHLFKPNKDGVLMEDIVHYKIPFGAIGKLANSVYVKHQLKNVFDYRYQKVEELFNR